MILFLYDGSSKNRDWFAVNYSSLSGEALSYWRLEWHTMFACCKGCLADKICIVWSSVTSRNNYSQYNISLDSLFEFVNRAVLIWVQKELVLALTFRTRLSNCCRKLNIPFSLNQINWKPIGIMFSLASVYCYLRLAGLVGSVWVLCYWQEWCYGFGFLRNIQGKAALSVEWVQLIP